MLEKLRDILNAVDIVEVIDTDIVGHQFWQHQIVLIPLLCFKDLNNYQAAVEIE